jgi:hypothetical protein
MAPSTMFTMRSASSMMRLSWVTIITVHPSWVVSSSSRLTTVRLESLSGAAVGSSVRISFGRLTRARATATR